MSQLSKLNRARYFISISILLVLSALLVVYISQIKKDTKIRNTTAYDLQYFNNEYGNSTELVEESMFTLAPKIEKTYLDSGWRSDIPAESLGGIAFMRFIKEKDVVSISLISRGAYTTEVITEQGFLTDKGWLIDKENVER
jgi:hypothetical protein